MINASNRHGGILAHYRKPEGRISRRLGEGEYAGFVHRGKNLDTILKACGVTVTAWPDGDWTKLLFPDYDTRRKFQDDYPSLLEDVAEVDVSPVRRFMADHHCVIDRPLRMYFDTETDSRGTIQQIVEGDRRILCITAVGEDGRKFEWCLDDDDNEAEAEGLSHFWDWATQYDQVCAWNGDLFDFPALDNRTKKLIRKARFESYKEHRHALLMCDHLAAFKRFNTASESGDEKTSMALQNVAMALVGEGKNDFNSRKTWEAWAAGGADRRRMVEYCEQDTALLPKIEVKTEYLELFLTLCQLTTAFPNSYGLKPTAQVDAALLRKAHLAKTHLPSKKHREVQPYEGAFVMPPRSKGIERNVHVCDFASLYPSIMRTWNMGTETKGQTGCVSPGTGVTFGVEEESMLAETVREAMSLRTVWKKKKEALPPGTDDWKDADRKSTAYKVFCNSIYGVCGSPYSRYYDLDIVRSVTLNGQWLIKETIAAAEQRGMRTVYGDTDSVFICGTSKDDFNSFVKWCNSDLYPRLLTENGCNPEFACVKLAYEKAFDRLVFPVGKDGTPVSKRYAGSYSHYGGTAAEADSKPEIKGLEYKRGDAIRYTRRMQEECIKMILSGQEDPEVFERWVDAKRQHVMYGPVELDDIVMTKGLSRELDDYTAKMPHLAVARVLEARGEDVSPGTRVGYVVIDGTVSPSVVIPSTDYDGQFDRRTYWNKIIYPATMRVLCGAFPNRNWRRWTAPKAPRVLAGQVSLGLS